MTPDAIASRLQLLRSHKGKLAEQMRRTEAAIHFTDGQIKEVEHWAAMIEVATAPVRTGGDDDISKATPLNITPAEPCRADVDDFTMFVDRLMSERGFELERTDRPIDQDAFVFAFRKLDDDQPAWVTVSGRELRINRTVDAMEKLAEARVKNALNTYEHHKATPVEPPADVEMRE